MVCQHITLDENDAVYLFMYKGLPVYGVGRYEWIYLLIYLNTIFKAEGMGR